MDEGPARPAGPVVLLVDDHAAIRRTVAAGLELEGFSVVAASGGRAALEAAARIRPAVVLLDLNMPDLDGLEVLRRLRDGGDQVPVCVLSARDEVDERVRGLQAGADDYIVKPFACRRSSRACRRCCAGAPPSRARRCRRATCGSIHAGAAPIAASARWTSRAASSSCSSS